MLIEAQGVYDDQERIVDVLCFTKSKETSDVRLGTAEVDANADNNEDAESNPSEEANIFDDKEAPEELDVDPPETDSAVQPAGARDDGDNAIDGDNAESTSGKKNEIEEDAVEGQNDGADAEDLEGDLNVTAMEATTSAHDDWLHRGPFLFDVDFHTYMRFVERKPRSRTQKVTDVDRIEHCFLFDSHYALAGSYWQHWVTEGKSRLVVMEALKCPLPNLNKGEDNAVFKSLIGTLMKCPGPGRCADPLLCKAGFFQVTVPESSKQTDESELPQWIVEGPVQSSELPQRRVKIPCPLSITRRTHADNVPSTFSCRLQWKARRAEIDVLAEQARELTERAKRIPVPANITLARGWLLSV